MQKLISKELPLVIVRGNSMFPLLKHGEHLNADYSYYQRNKVSKGDIVLVKI